MPIKTRRSCSTKLAMERTSSTPKSTSESCNRRSTEQTSLEASKPRRVEKNSVSRTQEDYASQSNPDRAYVNR